MRTKNNAIIGLQIDKTNNT